MFCSVERPEDRPFTLTWLYTQFIASYLVLIPLLAYFESREMLPLVMIIIIANGVGDGLAEPVGIRFGKRKYTTYALFTKQKYVRSYIGSACVLITTVIAILAFHQYFNSTQLIAALLLMPILITLAEAFSPHTWDSPLIYATGGASLIGIFHYLWFERYAEWWRIKQQCNAIDANQDATEVDFLQAARTAESDRVMLGFLTSFQPTVLYASILLVRDLWSHNAQCKMRSNHRWILLCIE